MTPEQLSIIKDWYTYKAQEGKERMYMGELIGEVERSQAAVGQARKVEHEASVAIVDNRIERARLDADRWTISEFLEELKAIRNAIIARGEG